jgi:hypothetical protein
MWEVLRTVGNDIKSDRQEVLGGWIVRTFKTNEYGSAVEQAFVSDPTHKWQLKKEIKSRRYLKEESLMNTIGILKQKGASGRSL